MFQENNTGSRQISASVSPGLSEPSSTKFRQDLTINLRTSQDFFLILRVISLWALKYVCSYYETE